MRESFFDTYVALDFETATGKRNSACQLGMVLVKGNQIMEKRNYLIQPPNNYYTPMTMAVHGITPNQTRHQPTFDYYWPSIKEWVNEYPIVCHNKSFDISVMMHTCEYYGITDLNIQEVHCTYQLTRMKLTDACRSLDVPIGQHHDGLADAIMCAQIYSKLRTGAAPQQQKLWEAQQEREVRRRDLFNQIAETTPEKVGFFRNRGTIVTGVFEHFSRQEILWTLEKQGAFLKSAISRKVEIVVMGNNPGPSKLEKISELRSQGYEIQMIDEEQLLRVLKN